MAFVFNEQVSFQADKEWRVKDFFAAFHIALGIWTRISKQGRANVVITLAEVFSRTEDSIA